MGLTLGLPGTGRVDLGWEGGAVRLPLGLCLCCRHVTYCGVMCFPLMVQDVTQRGMLGK